jgi:hypothetical protein
MEALLDPARVTVREERDGYLDLLGDDGDPTGRLPGQRLMASRVLPLIYESIWRPFGDLVFACQASELLRRRSPSAT